MTLANAGKNRGIPIIALCRLNPLPAWRSILSMKGSRNSPCDFMKLGLLLNLRECVQNLLL